MQDTASTLKGSLDAAKEMIGKVPAMTPDKSTHSSITVQNSWTTRQMQLRCRATAWNRYPRSRCIIKLVDSTPRGADRRLESATIGYKQLKLNEESLESGLTP